MTSIPFLDLKVLNLPYQDELCQAACRVISSGRYINGENVAEFEAKLAAFCQTDVAVAVSNGLDALRLTLRAYIELGQLKPGDEIIVPANTYIASVLAISDCDLKPVPVDASLLTMNLDTTLIESHITPHTRGIMPVHLYGSPCWDNVLSTVARKYGLIVVEDNAQAIGAAAATAGLNGTHATGSLGHAAATSFYPTKNLGALGDAGAVTTNDTKLANTIRALANYGADRRYHNVYHGCNCRMDEIQAAMLLVKLNHTVAENKRRATIAQLYSNYITNPLVTTPAILPGTVQVWHQYVILVADGQRDAMQRHLADNGIGTDIHYPTPPHRQPCYTQFANLNLPVADTIAAQALSLPIAHITPDQVATVAESINNFRP